MPEYLRRLVPDPDSPESRAYAAQRKARLAVERDLKKLRAEHFRGSRKPALRQEGIFKLRTYSDPAIFPVLLELFERESEDVQTALLDHLLDQRSDEGDATIAWAAVFGVQPEFRDLARQRLDKRLKALEGKMSNRVQWAVSAGLDSHNEERMQIAAELARDFRLFEAIPKLINLQVSGGGGVGAGAGGVGVGNGNEGAIALILIGTQQAFVSDLTPVVGDNAVAFDPTIGVVTSGTYIRVIDAVVVTYRTEIHNALVNLGNRGWDGRSTAAFGWDQRKWRDWYTQEFLPYRDALAGARRDSGSVKP